MLPIVLYQVVVLIVPRGIKKHIQRIPDKEECNREIMLMYVCVCLSVSLWNVCIVLGLVMLIVTFASGS